MEKAMATHSSTLDWKIPWAEEPGKLQSMGSLCQTQLSDFTFTFPFHALEKEISTYSSTLAWKILWMEEPGRLQSMGVTKSQTQLRDYTCLPRSKHLLISWLQSPSVVILEPRKIKSDTVSTVSPSICHEMIGLYAMIFMF